MVSRILGPDGQPIQINDIVEPQTAKIASLHHEWQGHPSRGLTPSKLASILDGAEQGDIVAQFELFEDMEEKDAHIASEMGKRRRALLQIEWDIQPPPNPSAAEKKAAARVKEMLIDIPDFEEMLFDTTDAIGKSFACLEMEWHRIEGFWLPKAATHRPQTWFKLHRGVGREEIRLRNGGDGEPLQPFGWITHTHKAKSGWLARAALFRVLVWPYLFKNYSVADLAEFLEIYGLPLRVGKYPPGASEKEKFTLLRALSSIGHKAAGIVPEGMNIEFHDAATGDPDAYSLMVDWCERSQSKAILGGTLTSQTSASGGGAYALGNVHNEVRKDLCKGDARQVASTITRDLIYAICAINGLVDGMRRCPRFVLPIPDTEDIGTFATALPTLVKTGMRIERTWAQGRLGIPEPEEGADILLDPDLPVPTAQLNARRQSLAVASAQHPQRAYSDALADALMERAGPHVEAWLDIIRREVIAASDFDDLLARLSVLIPELPLDALGQLLADASAAADRAGRADVEDESRRA